MRDLTAKQKSLLKGWFKKGTPTIEQRTFFGAENKLTCVDELTHDQWEQLVKINDTEILWQNANRFLLDLMFEQTVV